MNHDHDDHDHDDRASTEEGMAIEIAHPENSPQIASFEDGLTMLSDIVSRLESGGLGLTESIEAYERGVGILRQLYSELARADQRVSLLVRIDEDGKPVLAAFGPDSDDPGPGEQLSPRRRGRAKTSRGRSLPGMDDESAEA